MQTCDQDRPEGCLGRKELEDLTAGQSQFNDERIALRDAGGGDLLTDRCREFDDGLRYELTG